MTVTLSCVGSGPGHCVGLRRDPKFLQALDVVRPLVPIPKNSSGDVAAARGGARGGGGDPASGGPGWGGVTGWRRKRGLPLAPVDSVASLVGPLGGQTLVSVRDLYKRETISEKSFGFVFSHLESRVIPT